MNSQKRICKHTEIKYICLEESCLEKSDYKLDCLKCLQAIHPHFDCLIHCETIIEDAQNNQKIFLDLFEQNQMFCESLKQKLELNIHEIKQKYLEWIDIQSKLSLQQIEQYELSLKEQKENFMKAELTSDQLKTAIEFSLFNNEQYTQDNLQIQQLIKIKNHNNKYITIQINLININSQILYIYFQLLSDQFKEVIKRKFQSHSKQVKQFQLIYLGKRDGLNFSSYQSKVSGKNSLMIVCRSINDGQYVFGGYYHGCWSFNQQYLADDTGISFVFSQTLNQIYPIKTKTHAQLLGGSYLVHMGPDFYINSDFINGSQSLGNYYSTEQYQIQQNHLYGGPTPNVIECEVYQILF